jgi:hypothetical protein
LTEQADAPKGDEDLEIEVPAGDDPAQSTEAGSTTGDQVDGDEPGDEIEVTFGDEAAPASNEGQDSGLVRKLRAEIRERDARLAALSKGEPPKAIEVGEKPTLAAFDYDEDRFETELDAWKDRSAKAEQAGVESRKAKEAVSAAWAEELADFGRKKTALGARDFNAAEEEVVSTLSQTQQAIVVKASENSAQVIYALGRHPAKLATLAAIEDPIKFAVAVSKLEGALKVTTRRKAPDPEGTVRGSAPLSHQTDKHLERLNAEAARNNDRTKVIAYKRSLKAKAKV